MTNPTNPTHPSPRATTNPAALTQQRLDPLGALAAWPLAPVIAAMVVSWAVLSTALQADQIRHPLLSVLALVAVAGAAGMLVIAARPSRAPFRFGSHLVIVGLAVSAHLLDQAARWGSNALVQDDFGPIAIGLLLLALAPYRPWREIALSALASAVIVAAVTLPQAAFLSIRVPPAVYAVVSVTQVLAPALAGAAYSRRIVRMLLAWQTDARRAIVERTEESRGQVVRAVIEQQLASHNAGVFPLFEEVLARGEVTKADIARANELAGQVRQELVQDIDKIWMDAAVARERAELEARGVASLLVVANPGRRVAGFGPDQRAATAALISALCQAPRFDPCSLVVQITGSAPAASGINTVTIQAGIDLPARQVRTLLRPYLGVLRVVFGRIRVSIRRPLLTLEFDDQR
jgi:hypothetical protein